MRQPLRTDARSASVLAPVLAFAFAFAFEFAPPASAETFSFSADGMSGSFSPGKENAVLTGNARVVSGTLEIRADRIEISGKDWRYVRCYGAVVAEDKEKGIRFITETFFHDRVARISRMEGPSTLEDRRNRLVVKGSWIENDDATEIAKVRIDARILREDLACRAEFARYDRGSGLLELSGSPVVVKDGDEYRAARIVVDVDTEEIWLEGSVSGSVSAAAGSGGKPAPGDGEPDAAPAAGDQ
ncbi:MAG TPA: LptA/OstA family protein [Spirochaetales bacterium]|nr:LptA/OstA family protein [Spirochaetales bacterium]